MPISSAPYKIVKNIDVDESGDVGVGTRARLHGIIAYNTNAAELFLKIYNKATAPTVGTDVPAMTIGIPPAGTITATWIDGIMFETGVGLGATTGVADNDTGAPGANDMIVTLLYV